MPNKTNLSLSTFLLNAVNLKAMLQELTIHAENKTVNSKGMADRYAFAQAVKQAQTVNVTANRPTAGTNDATSLDITVWQPFGGDILAVLKSGSVKITTTTVEQSGAAMAYEDHRPNGTDAEITSSHMVSTNAALIKTAMTGAITDFNAACTITVAGKTIQVNVLLSAASHKIVRDELQMEDVTLKLQGVPTTPVVDDSTLLYLILSGAAAIAISTNTGANTYSETLITMADYELTFHDADLIKESLTLKTQGAMTVA